MNPTVISLILFAIMILFFALGMEIAVTIGLTATIGLVIIGRPPIELITSAFNEINSFVLTCIPLFIFMGSILASSGIIKNLFIAIDKFISGFPGGVLSSIVAVNAVFGAMSGSSLAAVATFGKISLPELEDLGYSPRISLGAIAAAGGLSILIPPSLVLVVYGGYTDTSVAKLFAASTIPGIIMMIFFIITVIVLVKFNPSLIAKPPRYSIKERMIAILGIWPFLIIIGGVLGTIFAGIMTPTESAALGAFLAVVAASAYRKMSFAAFREALLWTVKITAMIVFILFLSKVLGIVFYYLRVTDIFSEFVLGLSLGRFGLFAIICLMYIFLGMFMDGIAMLLITLPFISALIGGLGFSFLWFGVVYTVLDAIGLLTPPVGLNLYVLHSVDMRYSIMEIARSSLPFLIPMFVLIVLMTVFPELVLWLPSALY